MHVRFDWLTVTFKDKGPEDVNQLLNDVFGLSKDFFDSCRARYGYKDGLFFENITVLMNGGVTGMGVCFDISGQGCTYLYSKNYSLKAHPEFGISEYKDPLAEDPFTYIFKMINSLGGSITRLDVALDCFDHELSYDDMCFAYDVHNYSSRWKRVELIKSRTKFGVGFTLNFGSKQSQIMLRIYNKLVEQGCTDLDYWCRLELQCRDDQAHAFADTYLNRDDLDFVELFLGVLNHYMRFIDRKYDNGSMCPTLPWWGKFIESVRESVILRHEECPARYYCKL